MRTILFTLIGVKGRPISSIDSSPGLRLESPTSLCRPNCFFYFRRAMVVLCSGATLPLPLSDGQRPEDGRFQNRVPSFSDNSVLLSSRLPLHCHFATRDSGTIPINRRHHRTRDSMRSLASFCLRHPYTGWRVYGLPTIKCLSPHFWIAWRRFIWVVSILRKK